MRHFTYGVHTVYEDGTVTNTRFKHPRTLSVCVDGIKFGKRKTDRIMYEKFNHVKLATTDVVIHKDGNKDNYALSNLVIKPRGNVKRVRDKLTGKIYKSTGEAAKALFVNPNTIYYHCTGKTTNSTYGIEVEYVDD